MLPSLHRDPNENDEGELDQYGNRISKHQKNLSSNYFDNL
jgi:hypothetical protein